MSSRTLVALLSLLLLSSACPSKTTLPEAAVETPKRDVVPLSPGEDPFRNLPGPTAGGTRATEASKDTIRLGPTPPPEPTEVAIPFPPPEPPRAPAAAQTPPLAVLRASPQGKDELVGAVVVAFNQPMVPLASVGELKGAQVPLKITPEVPGRFRWIDPSTLAFEPVERMPFATHYRATVAAGTRSALGQVLDKEYAWEFETPRPQLAESLPYDGLDTADVDTTVKLLFNAAVSPEQIGPAIAWTAGKGAAVPFDVVAPGISANEKLSVPQHWDRRRSVVLVPKGKLAPGTRYQVVLSKNLTSSEGPLPMGKDTRLQFTTYMPLAVERIGCAWGDASRQCQVGEWLAVEFNNPLAPQKLDGIVQVSPRPDEMKLRVAGNTVQISGEFLPSTTYAVQVIANVKDAFGQSLQKPASGRVTFAALEPQLDLASVGQGIVTLESKLGAQLPAVAVNVAKGVLRLAPVAEKDLVLFGRELRYNRERRSDDKLIERANPKIRKEIPLAPTKNEIAHPLIDLRDALSPEGTGWVLVELEAPELAKRSEWMPTKRLALVQVTNVGATAALSDDRIHVLVTSLDEAKPLAGARVRLLSEAGKALAEATTDEKGVCSLPGPKPLGTSGPFALVAESKGDRAFLLLDGHVDAGSSVSNFWGRSAFRPDVQSVAFAFTERGAYRPEETVHLSVIARQRRTGPAGDLEQLPPNLRTVTYEVHDARGVEAGKGSLQLSAFGTGSFEVPLKKDAALGTWLVEFHDGRGQGFTANFDVKEYRAPEFKVTVERSGDTSAPLVLGGKAQATVTGSYFFGAPMSGAEVQWRIYRAKSHFTPPGNDGFSFGEPPEPLPWFGLRGRGMHGFGKHGFVPGEEPMEGASGAGVLDGQGRLVIPVELQQGPIDKGPVTFTVEADVTDRNRQSVSGRTDLLAHRSLRYVGVRLDRSVVRAGDEVRPQFVVTGLDGKRIEGVAVRFKVLQEKWDEPDETEDGEEKSIVPSFQRKEVEVGSCETKSKTEPAEGCGIKVPKAGRYILRAFVKDDAGRENMGAVRFWAYGEGEVERQSGELRVDLVADKTEYEPGETARLLVNSPFPNARGFLLLSREGFADVRPLVIEKGSALVDVRLEERWMPAIHAQVVLVRGRTSAPDASGQDEGRPRFASGEVGLNIARAARRIAIDIAPSTRNADPGSEITIAVGTKDAQGRPIAANVALMVVDEGVLSLTAFATPNPLEALYLPIDPETGVADVRPLVLPRSEVKLGANEPGRGGGGMAMKKSMLMRNGIAAAPMAAQMAADEGGAQGPQFAVRSFFATTAYFNGAVTTDANGRAQVKVKLPDNLTEFRVMAVAADNEKRFGSSDTQIRTRKPILVRPSLPRFTNVGDKFEASAVINNETGADTEVLVRLLAVNARVGQERQSLQLKAGEAKEVRFPVEAGLPGPATYQFAAIALTQKRPTDAAEVTIPTLIPATAEAFAAYGAVEQSVRQPVSAPSDVLPGYGGLELALSSTALTGLSDAVNYLVEYPYECAEQTASRLVPLVALKDLLVPLKIGTVQDEAKRQQLVKSAITRLLTYRRGDGGFGFWRESDRSYVYVSAYVLHALQLAKEAGEEIPSEVFDAGAAYLQRHLDKPENDWEDRDPSTQAMAALVLTRLQRPPLAHLERLSAIKELPVFAKAWLYEAWSGTSFPTKGARIDELHRQIANAAVESAGSIHFAEVATESLRLLMHSDDRTDAIVLHALLQVDAKDPLVEKAQRGLMRARVKGRWSTTQANAYALLALRDYFRIYEAETPAFDARLWLGDLYVAGRRFEGRELTVAKTLVPMAEVQERPKAELIVGKEGPGRLYYRVGLRYAPKDLRLKPEEQGFAITRSYEGLDNLRDVQRNEDGSWTVKAGALVRVGLVITAPDRRYYVAVVDPLPAGFEAVDVSFATSARRTHPTAERIDERPWWGWWSPWNHSELRDDRTQLFADRLSAGVYEYTYTARATGIGTFVTPPTRAEEMYAPETFGRAGTDVVKVVP